MLESTSLLLVALCLGAAEPRLLTGHDDNVYGLAFSADGKTLASAGADETVKLWDVAKGEVRLTFGRHGAPVYCAAFSPDGKTVASSGGDRKVRLWDAATGKELRPSPGTPTRSIASPFPRTASVWLRRARTGRCACGTPPRGKELAAIKGHTAARSTASPSARTARLLASSGGDGTRAPARPGHGGRAAAF